jgi:hypothetical protein
MKKILNFIRNDSILRNNILYAGALALLFGNIVGLIIGFDGFFKEGHFNDFKILFFPVLGIDTVFIFSLLFMYVISDRFFRIKNAIITSFTISALIAAYFALTTDIPAKYIISETVNGAIQMSYALIGLGIIIRSFWEDMQDRVGGKYKSLDFSYDSILSYRNISLISISFMLYFATDIISQYGKYSINLFINTLLLGLITFSIGSFIRLIISVYTHKFKKA